MSEPTAPLEQIIAHRREKIDKLRAAGIDPYPSSFAAPAEAAQVQANYASLNIGESSPEPVTVAGRMVSRREMGKASFADIVDASGKIQLYFKANVVGDESFRRFKDLADISDFIGARGTPFKTKTGELTVNVESWSLLAKTLRPLPEKWHGLKDTETRYRQRYLDLIANPGVRDVFVKRSRVISAIRQELDRRGFLEVETPMMQTIPGGAAARPFITHHNALDIDLFLRIAPELYLKRLVVGGLEKVFEIGRNFRNEGIDRNHNPEFTMLELYRAYADYNDMMRLAEQIIVAAAAAIGVTLAAPFRRAKLFDLLSAPAGTDMYEAFNRGELRAVARRLAVPAPEDADGKKLLDHLFDALVAPSLNEPTFVIDYPAAHSPLAKPKAGEPGIAERFELFIGGKEVANAYSELNDPLAQKTNFETQMEARRQGDEEAQPYDADFVVALEHGLPPTGGLGIGIDRLVMVLAGVESIREIIFFPVLRPESAAENE